jgi:hypothetical protein
MRRNFENVIKSAFQFNMTFFENFRCDFSIVFFSLFHTSEIEIMAFNAPEIFGLFYLGIFPKFNELLEFFETCCKFMVVCTFESKTFTTTTTLGNLSV